MRIYLCCSMFVFLILSKVKSDLATTQAIKSLILNSYDSSILPQDLVQISVGLSFKQIVKLDQTSQILTSSSILIATWTDQRLTWNATQYPMQTITLKAKQIWLPDLYIINSADSNGFLPISDSNLAVILPNGFVYLTYSLTSKFKNKKIFFYFNIEFTSPKFLMTFLLLS